MVYHKYARRDGKVIHFFEDVLTVVGSGSTTTVTFPKLPPGFYKIQYFGTQTNASTASTLAFEGYENAAQSTIFIINSAFTDDAAGATTSTMTNTYASYNGVAYAGGTGNLVGDSAIFLPWGFRITYTKSSATAVNLHIVCIES